MPKATNEKIVVNVGGKKKKTRKRHRKGKGKMRRALAKKFGVPRSQIDLSKLTPGGLGFLKCAIAGVDFPGVRASGVPDDSSVPSFCVRNKQTFVFTVSSSALYVMVAPTPGVACWSTADTTTQWSPSYFKDFATLFGDTSTAPYGAVNATDFRYMSMSVEAKTTSSALNAAGSLCVARNSGVELTQAIQSSGPVQGLEGLFITGLPESNLTGLSSTAGSKVFHVNTGAYSWSPNDHGTWEFSKLFTGCNGINSNDLTLGGPALNGKVMGWGNLAPIMIALEGSNTSTNLIVSVETCIEYIPRAGTLMAEMCSPSCPHDPLAMEMYDRAVIELPAVVEVAKNDSFWESFLRVISGASAAIAPFAGPYAPIASGVGAIATGLRSIVFH